MTLRRRRASIRTTFPTTSSPTGITPSGARECQISPETSSWRRTAPPRRTCWRWTTGAATPPSARGPPCCPRPRHCSSTSPSIPVRRISTRTRSSRNPGRGSRFRRIRAAAASRTSMCAAVAGPHPIGETCGRGALFRSCLHPEAR